MSGDGGHHEEEEHEEHEEHVNHEAWVIPYADLLTLLMAMFVALFAISNVDLMKFKKLAEGFSDALRAGSGASATVVDLGGSGDKIFAGPLNALAASITIAAEQGAKAELDPSSSEAAATKLQNLPQAVQDAELAGTAELEAVQQIVQAEAAAGGLSANLQTRIDERGLVITVVTDQVVFGSGSADLGPNGAEILRVVGKALATVDNVVLVEGHTDNIPISTATFPSNWELSGARAGAVLRYFQGSVGLTSGRLQSAGFADTRPIDSNDTEAGRARNRRVEVIVESDAQGIKDRILEEAVQASDRLQRPESP
ncbi:MAG: flagellar motor protein MotB [Acidimicrobiales bacterium]